MATFGYCKPAGIDPSDPQIRLDECVDAPYRYKACLSWGLGILVDFQQTPSYGPYVNIGISHHAPLTSYAQALTTHTALVCSSTHVPITEPCACSVPCAACRVLRAVLSSLCRTGMRLTTQMRHGSSS